MCRGPLDVLLDVDVADAERRLGLALRRLERLAHFRRGADDAHATPAAAGDGLDDHRKAELPGDLEGLLFAIDRAVAAGQDGNAGLLHRPPRPRLVSEQTNHVRRRTDELDMAGFADLGKVGALGQEPVPGMNRVGAGDLGRAQHRRHVEITVGAARRPDAHVLVGEPDVQRVLVGLRIHRDRLDAQLAAGANHPQRDLPPVGDQDFLEHGDLSAVSTGLDREQPFPVLDRLAVLDVRARELALGTPM